MMRMSFERPSKLVGVNLSGSIKPCSHFNHPQHTICNNNFGVCVSERREPDDCSSANILGTGLSMDIFGN